jgi:predicted DNA-binding transcriptional regulator AlpA
MNEQQTRALTEQEVAKRFGLSVATLRAWRWKRKGPRFVRFGRAVRYLPADLDQFLEENSVETKSDTAGGEPKVIG